MKLPPWINDKRAVFFFMSWCIVGFLVVLTNSNPGENRVLYNAIALLTGTAVLTTGRKEIPVSLPIASTLIFSILMMIALYIALVIGDAAPAVGYGIASIIDTLGYYPPGPDADLVISLLVWCSSLLLSALSSFVIASALRGGRASSECD